MVTTYQISSEELDYNLINLIKSNFPNTDLFIDVYQAENIKLEIDEITNPEIIKRINDIKSNSNIVFPNIEI
jgi:hypothetical protein